MTIKICTTCNEELPIELFEITKNKYKSYYRNKCKNCRLNDIRNQRNKLKNNIKIENTHKICNTCLCNLKISDFNKKSTSKDGYAEICRKCYKIKRNKIVPHNIITNIELYCNKCKLTKPSSNFRVTARSSTGYFKTCISCWKPRQWNKEKQRESEKKYILNNPEKIKEKNKKQSQKPKRIIKSRLQNRIREILRSNSIDKKNKTISYIGCNSMYLKKWFEFQFTDDINWDNIHMWHIDHVIPCSSFDLTDISQVYKCFNWQNLRPCLAKDNLEKSSKIIQSLIDSHKELISKFLEINPLPT